MIAWKQKTNLRALRGQQSFLIEVIIVIIISNETSGTEPTHQHYQYSHPNKRYIPTNDLNVKFHQPSLFFHLLLVEH